MHEGLQQFHPVIGKWFQERVGIPTPPQVLGWPVIGAGKSALILAPTGSGKTLAAFLSGIDWLARRMMTDAETRGHGDTAKEGCPKLAVSPRRRVTVSASPPHGVQILYVSPLKALANDVRKNLLKPLEELADVAAGMGVTDWPEIQVGVRTGDTPQRERAAMARRPPQILITTPESLNLMLTTGARGIFSGVRFLIVDEVHALAGSKRGVFLSLVLERLEEERRRGDTATRGRGEKGRTKIAPGVFVEGEPVGELVRIGLSATARPEETIAHWLAGNDDGGHPRPTEIIRTGQRKRLDLRVVCPFDAGADLSEAVNGLAADRRSAVSREATEKPVKGTGHWPEVTRAVLEMIRAHRSTLVFGNGRQLVERLAARFQEELAREMDAGAETRGEEDAETRRRGDAASGTESANRGNGESVNMSEKNGIETTSDSSSPQLAASPCRRVAPSGDPPLADSPVRRFGDSTSNRIPVILPHHGSIAKEVRLETEQALKRGEVDAVLATSSLELGIDIGSLDLVVQIDSPGSIAAGLQRVGRAGHLEKATAKGRFVARGLYELPSFGALLPLMEAGVVEETHVPVNCLDVLAQQIVAACASRPQKRSDLFRMFRRAMPYAHLLEKQFDAVVGMLSRRAERVTALGAGAALRPRISFDRVNDELTALPGTAQVVLVNSGVIADTGMFPVYVAGTTDDAATRRQGDAARGTDSRGNRKLKIESRKFAGVRLGELDEEFVFETKEGDRIILGSQTWRVVRIDADRVMVERAAPGSSRMPFWRGEKAPRTEMLGEAVARFHGEMAQRLRRNANLKTQNSKPDEGVRDWLMREHLFDEQSAENAMGYYRRQLEQSDVPDESQIVVEHFVDRTGEPLIAILSPLGSRVNYALRLALEVQFARRRLPAQVVHHDDGILIRPPTEVAGGGEVPENPLVWLTSKALEAEIADQLESTALFGMRFRQNAARALMLPKMTLSQRTPLWQQRLRARHLLALVKQQRNFPIMVETYRECMQDVLAIPQVTALLAKIERGDVGVKVVRQRELGVCSPFARSLFSQFTAAYLYEWDDPLVPGEIEPAVDQRVLDEILRKRGAGADESANGRIGEPAKKSWAAEDERSLARRISGADYPARTGEELLEKIEAAGAAGVALGGADDPSWGEWAVGGTEEARRMLGDLLEKRRVVRALMRRGRRKEEQVWRWVGIDNVALLIAARGGGRPRLEGADYGDLPAAILQTDLPPEDARRVVIEQTLRREAITTREAVLAELAWMDEAPALLEEMRRAGKVLDVISESGEPQVLWAEYAEQLRAIALRRERRGAATADLAALQRHLIHWQHVQPATEAAMAGDSLRTQDAVEDVLDQLMGLSFSLETWEHEILTSRVPGFTSAVLDNLFSGGGHWVWVGSGTEEIALWPRHMLMQRRRREGTELSLPARRVADFLRQRGASFGFDMQLALSMDERELALALKELVFAGGEIAISNDQLSSLRDVLRVAGAAKRDERKVQRQLAPPRTGRDWWRGGVPSPARSRRARHAMTAGNLGGRWFLLPPLAADAMQTSAIERAQQAADRVERFLRRTGFACRELLESESDGPWKDAYDVLTRMEWAGTVRRGYFVDGIAGSQFMTPGVRLEAIESANRREGESAKEVHWLSMLDPANIWARASTHWVSDAGLAARVPRMAGSWVAMIDGRPVLAAVSWAQRLVPLPAAEKEQMRALETLGSLLPRFPRLSHRFMQVRFWDQQEIPGTRAEKMLHAQGFTRDPQGLRLYRTYATAGNSGGGAGE